MKHIATVVQNLLPQPHLALAFGRLARSRRPWLRRLMISVWMKAFAVSLAEARRSDPADYESFEDFFTRELQAGARRQPDDDRLLTAPADGVLQAFGPITGTTLLQAKGIDYPLGSLLGDHDLARTLDGGWYATVYLRPGDYHRIHAPCDATLRAFTTIPGQAYSVTDSTRRNLPDLYCRNERLVCLFDTRFGPMALVMVGAMLVTGIETVWRPRQRIDSLQTTHITRDFQRGAELGRFTLGSTVVLLLPAGAIQPTADLRTDQRILVGTPFGRGRER
jgi:phosphatidylserine decarboxylase